MVRITADIPMPGTKKGIERLEEVLKYVLPAAVEYVVFDVEDNDDDSESDMKENFETIIDYVKNEAVNLDIPDEVSIVFSN